MIGKSTFATYGVFGYGYFSTLFVWTRKHGSKLWIIFRGVLLQYKKNKRGCFRFTTNKRDFCYDEWYLACGSLTLTTYDTLSQWKISPRVWPESSFTKGEGQRKSRIHTQTINRQSRRFFCLYTYSSEPLSCETISYSNGALDLRKVVFRTQELP